VVSRVPVYRWGLPEDITPLRRALDQILSGQVDVVLFTNAVQVEHVMKLLEQNRRAEEFQQALRQMVVASIGQIASERLRNYDLPVDLEPSHPKMGILVKEVSERARNILENKRQKRN
jgi:uroporphyrinogen-III synthase